MIDLVLNIVLYSNNVLYRRGKFSTYINPKHRNLKKEIISSLKDQWKKSPIKENIELKLTYYFKDKRRRDVANYEKMLVDCLNGIVYEDDCQIVKLTLIKQIESLL